MVAHGYGSQLLLSFKDGKEQRKQMEASELDKAQRPFLLESVVSEKHVEGRITKSYILLDAFEFEKTFGNKPRSKDPKCAQITMPDVDGTMCTFFVFQDPDAPYRKLHLSASMAELKDVELLTRDMHLHKTQAASTMDSRTKARLNTTGICPLLDRRLLHNLSTLSQYRVLEGPKERKESK
eukprot:6469527-Amphidinium_carterae.3